MEVGKMKPLQWYGGMLRVEDKKNESSLAERYSISFISLSK
jgi:hypothetical protein